VVAWNNPALFGEVLEGGQAVWAAMLTFAELYLTNQWARAAGMAALVAATIWVIAHIYSGNFQNAEIGPVGIRPHKRRRDGGDVLVIHKNLMPFNMDGVSTLARVYYVYDDARGKRRKRLVYKHRLTLNVMAIPLPSVQSIRYGHEVPDEVHFSDICVPNIELDSAASETIQPTEELAKDYVARRNILQSWTDDDNAPIISVAASIVDRIAANREHFITTRANALRRLRQGGILSRWRARGLAAHRPNVIGSYYLRLQFAKDPFFVLFRHPDRDLKLTAWLTVLTSLFAVAMELWPVQNADDRLKATDPANRSNFQARATIAPR